MLINTIRIADHDLIIMIRRQSKEGAEMLFDTYAKALFLAIIRITPDQEIAEDILEQSLLTVWRSFDTYSTEKETLLRRMMQIARKLARNHASFRETKRM